MGPNPPQHDPTYPEYHYQPQHQQEVWQQEYPQQQQYQMNHGQQSSQQRWQGRGLFPVQAGDRDMYAGGIVYPHKYLLPPRDNFGGINEEIRVQADLQCRQQQYDEFESGLPYDPYLVCHKCNHQFREGQLPEYRHHIDNCHQ